MGVGVRCFQCKEKVQGWGTGRQHANDTGHTWQPGYYCTDCKKTFSTHKLCKQHIKEAGVHSKAIPPKTSTVFTTGPSSSSASARPPLVLGRLVQLPVGVLASSKSSSSASEIVSKAENGSSPLQCTMCPLPATFSSKEALERHAALTCTCTKCSIHFYASAKLQDHYRTSKAHPNCRECGDGFPGLTEWATHRARCPPPVAPAAESTQGTSAPRSISDGFSIASASARDSDVVSCDGVALESSEVFSLAPSNPLLKPTVTARSHDTGDSISNRIIVSEEDTDENPVTENQDSNARILQDNLASPKVDKGKGKAFSSNEVPTPTTITATLEGGVQRTAANPLSFHCRSCLANPCVEPVATLCGHIFCRSCIVREVTTKMCCPVCQRQFLVRLHVGVGS